MAVGIRGSNANSSGGAAATSLLLVRPGNWQLGDVMVVVVSYNGGTGITVTPPSGWTTVTQNNNTTNLGQAVYLKVSTASEPGSYTWNLTSCMCSISAVAYTGVDANNPTIGSGTAATTTASTTTANPTATPGIVNAYGVLLYSTLCTTASGQLLSGVPTNYALDVRVSNSATPSTEATIVDGAPPYTSLSPVTPGAGTDTQSVTTIVTLLFLQPAPNARRSTSQIIIDRVSSITTAASPASLNHVVSSQDCVMVIMVNMVGTVGTPVVRVDLTSVPVLVNKPNSTTDGAAIAYLVNPPVGSINVTATLASNSIGLTVVTLLGVDKATTTPVTASASASSTISTTVQVASANSIILDTVIDTNLDNLLPTRDGQVAFNLSPVSGVQANFNSYQLASPGLQTMAWGGGTGTLAQAVIVLEPAHAPSIWFPNIDNRNIGDVVQVNALDASFNTTGAYVTFGNYASDFWQNSFLHTVGRIIAPPQGSPTLVAETELQTSQVVIDKISQSALSSATSITLDHNVSSQDAVMLIFASNMGVSQAINGLTVNGASLTPMNNNSISTLAAGMYFLVNPNVGVNAVSFNVTLPTALELVVMTLLGVDKKTSLPVAVTGAALVGSPSVAITPAAANSVIVDYVGTLVGSGAEDSSQTPYFNQPQVGSGAFGSIKLATNSPQTMSWTTSGAAWVQFAVALEPANAPSIWFPTIDQRNMSDVIAVNGLDDSTNPQGNFSRTDGTHPTQLWQNSFLHTIGRLPVQSSAPIVNASVTQVAGVLTVSGGTQTVATVNNVALSQSAAVLTAAGGAQSVATVNDVSVTQSAATLTVTGGTQTIATVNEVSVPQAAAVLTVTGGTQTVVAIALSNASITQVAATLTVTGGTQTAVGTVTGSASVTQVAGVLTISGGTQSIATVNDVSLAQSHATLTATGGTQTIATVQIASVSQSAATLTVMGGTQSVVAGSIINASITQVRAVLTVTGGTQTIASQSSTTVTQSFAAVTATGGVQTIFIPPPPIYTPLFISLQAQNYSTNIDAVLFSLGLGAANTTFGVDASLPDVSLSAVNNRFLVSATGTTITLNGD